MPFVKYILVYEIDDYPDNGGGTKYEEFNTVEALDKRVIEIYNFHDITIAGKVEEFKYKPVETVTKIERE